LYWPQILAVVLSVKRKMKDYLLQSVVALDREIKSVHASDEVSETLSSPTSVCAFM
jgi:hypothetical protein